ncbi:MAG: type II toxin-antitoxin system HipA family toxin [Idiomarina sp.]|nr:type II toxin-antitoxin system HipA family toxin [Idiomarina sp.]
MGRRSLTDTLYCSMNGFLVGRLFRRKGRLSFQYEKEWLGLKGSRPISLSIPLQSSEITTDSVHAYFDNLLPDSDIVRKHIVDRLGADSLSPFDLLAAIGGDCIGAISLTVAPPENAGTEELSLTPLTESGVAEQIKRTRVENTLGLNEDDDFRISLAGAQEKTALTYWNEKWCMPHGMTATTHIFKPPIMHHPQMALDMSNSVENEWFCLRFLHHLGFDVAEADILMFKGQKALVVKRFDRKVESEKELILRLPQEDMCQALGRVSGSKYEEHGGPSSKDIMDTLSRSIMPHEDRLTFFKTQVAFWLLAAIDGHAKNFSIHLQANGFKLCPIYDVMSAYPYFGQGNIQSKKIKMAMKVHSKNTHYRWYNILGRHWLSHGRYLRLSASAVKQVLGELLELTEPALNKALEDAPTAEALSVGETIKARTLSHLARLDGLAD